MKDLNTSLNMLKSNDSNFLGELQQKTERFLNQLDTANNEIAMLKSQNENFLSKKANSSLCLKKRLESVLN